MDYQTLDYLPDLTSYQMNGASTLGYQTSGANTQGWDVFAYYSSTADYAILRDTFKFTGLAGARYDMVSTSFFDPFLIEVYDQFGNVMRVNDSNDGTYGSDFVTNFVAPYTGTYYVSAGWDQGSYHTFVSFLMEVDLDPAKRRIEGSSGNDVIQTTEYLDQVDGGAGMDRAIEPGLRSAYKVTFDGKSIHVTASGAPDGDVLFAVERVSFSDGTLAFDFSGNAGQVYRLYQAAFDRAPDRAGLGYQIAVMDGGSSLQRLAQDFLNSPEFQATYGSLDNTAFITALYANVLNRAPDAGGLAYHLNDLAHGVTRAQLLGNFSESPENQANVLPAIQAGIWY